MLILKEHWEKYKPVCMFSPALFVPCIYAFPAYAKIWVGLCVIIFFLFLYHIYTEKKENALLIVAIIPNTLGPILSETFLNARNIEVQETCHLFISYAFLIHSYISIVIYIAFKQNLVKPLAIWICLIVLLFLTIFRIDAVFASGPELDLFLVKITAPDINLIFISRYLLTILIVSLSLNLLDNKR